MRDAFSEKLLPVRPEEPYQWGRLEEELPTAVGHDFDYQVTIA